MIKIDEIVLKRVNGVHNDKIRSNGLERGQLGTQYNKNCGLGPKLRFLRTNQQLSSFKLKNCIKSTKTTFFAVFLPKLHPETAKTAVFYLSSTEKLQK